MRHRQFLSAMTGAIMSLTLFTPVIADNGGGNRGGHESRTVVVHAGQSIQEAIDAARPGTTINVEPGTYAEQLTIGTDRITISGRGATIVPPATVAGNGCTGMATLFGDPTGPPAEAGVCVIGDVTFGDFDPFLGHRPVTHVGHPVSGVTISGLSISGFGVGVAIAGGRDTRVERAGIDGVDPYGMLASGSPRTTYADNTITNGPDTIAGIGACMEGSPGGRFIGNEASGFIVGLCISSSSIKVIGNDVHDNNFGVFTDPGYGNIVIRDNRVHDNRRVSPIPVTGVGIIVDGSHDVTITGNRITGNVGDASTTGFVAGGVVVIDEPGFGAVADNIRVTGNVISGNGDGITSADLWVDSIGSGHHFDDNHCTTSRPAGLC